MKMNKIEDLGLDVATGKCAVCGKEYVTCEEALAAGKDAAHAINCVPKYNGEAVLISEVKKDIEGDGREVFYRDADLCDRKDCPHIDDDEGGIRKMKEREEKRYYRKDGTMKRVDQYDRATGKVTNRHYYRADETKERREEYDIATGKIKWMYYFRADGALEREEFYDEQGKLIEKK